MFALLLHLFSNAHKLPLLSYLDQNRDVYSKSHLKQSIQIHFLMYLNTSYKLF